MSNAVSFGFTKVGYFFRRHVSLELRGVASGSSITCICLILHYITCLWLHPSSGHSLTLSTIYFKVPFLPMGLLCGQLAIGSQARY